MSENWSMRRNDRKFLGYKYMYERSNVGFFKYFRFIVSGEKNVWMSDNLSMRKNVKDER